MPKLHAKPRKAVRVRVNGTSQGHPLLLPTWRDAAKISRVASTASANLRTAANLKGLCHDLRSVFGLLAAEPVMSNVIGQRSRPALQHVCRPALAASRSARMAQASRTASASTKNPPPCQTSFCASGSSLFFIRRVVRTKHPLQRGGRGTGAVAAFGRPEAASGAGASAASASNVFQAVRERFLLLP